MSRHRLLLMLTVLVLIPLGPLGVFPARAQDDAQDGGPGDASERAGDGAEERLADDPVELAEIAVLANPDVEALAAQVAALERRSEAVRVFADPVLSVEYSNVPWDTWALGDSPMSGLQVKLQQAVPLPGKNARRVTVVAGDIEAGKWELEEKRLQVRGAVQRAYWALALTRQLRDITARHIDLVNMLIESVRAKYEVGRVGQHDLLRLEVLRGRLTDDLGDFAERESALTATINAALHRDVTTPIATPAHISHIPASASLERLQAQALAHRPWLRQMAAQADARRSAAELARYERLPDFTVWAGYRIRAQAATDPGTDFFSVGVAVPLPFDYTGRSKARQGEQLERARAIEQARLAAIDRIDAELASSLAAWERAAGKAAFYSSRLIPDATTTLEATFAAYKVDRADFASLYQAELQLLEFERAVSVAVVETLIQRVRIETLTGDIPASRGARGE